MQLLVFLALIGMIRLSAEYVLMVAINWIGIVIIFSNSIFELLTLYFLSFSTYIFYLHSIQKKQK